jgi:hypothetical protein
MRWVISAVMARDGAAGLEHVGAVARGSGLSCSAIGAAVEAGLVGLGQDLLPLLQLGDAALHGLDAVAVLDLAQVGQRRLGAPGIGIAAAVEVGLGQRLGLDRGALVPGVDQDDFQPRIGRLQAERIRRGEADRQQGCMRQHREGDGDHHGTVVLEALHVLRDGTVKPILPCGAGTLLGPR